MSRFVLEQLDGTEDGRWVVKDTLKGWFVVMETKIGASFLKERFEELVGEITND